MARTHQQPPPSKNTVVGEAGIPHRGYLGSSRFEPASSSSEESTSFSDVDGEVSQHLKKLGRKDPTTKLKALASLCLLFKKKSGEELAQIVPQWAFEYKRLVLDYNREVRRGTHDAMTSLVTTVGKDLVPHLTSLMGPWWFAQFDPIPEVSQAAKRSLEAAFPTSERRLDALMLCITDIFLYLAENLKLAPQALSDKATPMVELEDMHQRVISSSSLLAVATLVDILGMKVQSNDSEAVTTKQKLALKAEVLLSLIEKVKGKIYQMKRKSVVHRVKHCRDVHDFKTGTTVIAATFNNGRGIIITSDTRISTEICPSTGSYNYREDYKKKINVLVEKKNFVGFSGNVRKAQNLVALINSNVGSVSGLQGIPITVQLVVKIAQGLFLKFQHLFFGVSLIVAGVDAGCANVYSISDSGDVTQDGVLSIGSGRSLVGRAKWSKEFDLLQIVAFTECEVSQAHTFDPYTGGYTHSFVTCGDDDYYIELFGGKSVETYINGACVYEDDNLKESYLGAELEVLYTSQFPEFNVSDVIV